MNNVIPGLPRPSRAKRIHKTLVASAGIAVLLAGSAFLSGCSDNSQQGAEGSKSSEDFVIPEASASTYPLMLQNCGMQVSIPKKPSRVVVLGGASVGEVETLISLNQEKSILGNAQNYGVSDEKGMPEKITKLPPIPGQGPTGATAEQILAAKPDLVISTWEGGFDPAMGAPTRKQLEEQGIASYINPAQCAKESGDKGINGSYKMMADFGTIFDAQQQAAAQIRRSQQAIRDSEAQHGHQDDVNALIAFPGMAAMNAHGLPAVMTGGIYDDVLQKAGVKNAIQGDAETMKTLTPEKLASADVDLLVLGQFSPAENPEDEARTLFEKYPQWEASKNKRWISVSDSIYYGPLNHIGVEKIAAAARN